MSCNCKDASLLISNACELLEYYKKGKDYQKEYLLYELLVDTGNLENFINLHKRDAYSILSDIVSRRNTHLERSGNNSHHRSWI